MSGIINLSRRDFLKTGARIGGGLVLGFSLSSRESSGAVKTESAAPAEASAFIRIGTDDTVTLIINKSEMGQGVYTSLAMLLAEELECDWKKVRVEPAPVAPVYNHPVFGTQMTGGSTSVWSEYDRLRKAGATAREMLIDAAARRWKVDRAGCRARDGVVNHATGKKLPYGQLADEASKMAPPETVRLKDPSAFRLIGKPTKRLDTPEKIIGQAVFGIDAKVPGMSTALIARPPVFGAKVASVNPTKARAVPGVQEVVQVQAGVAVVAADFWSAKAGRDALEVSWDEGEARNLSTASLREQYRNLAGTAGTTARKEGDAEQALAKAEKKISAEYEVPYLAHATMEPLNCLVDLKGQECNIWTGTQFQTVDRDAAARVAGLKPEQVRVHTLFLGGGFGRRANPRSDFVVEAVEVARAVKRPVKVIWTREDDLKGGYYRPMWYDRIMAGLDQEGKLTAWRHTIVGQSILTGTPFEGMVKQGIDQTSVEGAQDIPYAIPNLLVDLHSPKSSVPVLWWRSVGHSHTAFVVEGFLDEAAHLAGKDPFEFRQALLSGKPRHRRVLELAAGKAGWGQPMPTGHARGIAVHESFGSFVAQVAEVSVSREGRVRIHRVVCAIDCGRFVNPATIEAQMEGGIVFGLSAVLHDAITFKDGKVEQGNFNDYEMLRMNEMPKVEVHIIPSKEKSGGVGEPGVPPIAPAVANAVFAATGKRIRRLPIDPAELKRS